MSENARYPEFPVSKFNKNAAYHPVVSLKKVPQPSNPATTSGNCTVNILGKKECADWAGYGLHLPSLNPLM
jgi:hypothetical protein